MLFVSAQQDGQNMRKNWYFGTYGVSFESGVPVEKRNNPHFVRPAGCLSDPVTGKLLLYSDGKTAWNAKHREIRGGSSILPPGETYCNDVLIAPDPANRSKYYIFTVVRSFLYVAQVDMSLDNGNGAVVSAGGLLYSNVSYRIGITRYKRDNGWWLLAHGMNDNTCLAFLVHDKGIKPDPVITKTGYSGEIGFMVVSPLGNKVAMCPLGSRRAILQATFDQACGTFSNVNIMQSAELLNDVAFSPDGSKLYTITASEDGRYHRTIYQYGDFSTENVPGSINLVNEDSGAVKTHESIILGPDGKIYILTFHQYWLGYHTFTIIPKPNEKNCGFEDEAFRLNEAAAYNKFPTMIGDETPASKVPSKLTMNVSSSCIDKPIGFKKSNSNSYDSVRWQITGPGYYYTSEADQFSLLLPARGSYTVQLIGYDCIWNDTLTKIIRADSVVKPFLGTDTMICNEASLVLFSNVFAERYKWSDRSTQQSITVTDPGIYWVEIANGDCISGDTIEVKKYPGLWTALGDEYFICEDDDELVKLDAGEGFQEYRWTPTGDSTQWIIVRATGEYFVVVKDFRGCPGSDGTKVQRRCNVRLYFPDAFTPNANGLNDVYKPAGQDVTEFHIRIFNRWGGQVFSSDDLRIGWNGIAEGKYAPEGTYIYTCTYKGFQGKRIVEKSTKGKFTLIR